MAWHNHRYRLVWGRLLELCIPLLCIQELYTLALYIPLLYITLLVCIQELYTQEPCKQDKLLVQRIQPD